MILKKWLENNMEKIKILHLFAMKNHLIFGHRHLVAKWLKENGYNVEEWIN